MKPYDLVVVKNEDDFKHCGEVISYPITNENSEDTIMVRLVPNDPSTMKELPVSSLQKLIGRYSYVHYAKVYGRGIFPIDMLRYDFASPVNFVLENDRAVLNEGETDFIIARCNHSKNPDWTSNRWISFLWGIVPLKSLKIEKGN